MTPTPNPIQLAIHDALTEKARAIWGPTATVYFSQSPRIQGYVVVYKGLGGLKGHKVNRKLECC